MLNRWLAPSGGVRAWSGAFTVLVVGLALVLLDITVGSVHRYWSRHDFTSSVLSGLLVLLLTVLIVDRLAHLRRVRDQSRAVAAQAAVIVAQARRTAEVISTAAQSAGGSEAAGDELRTYALMLLTSAPVLIDDRSSRTFLEVAQRVALRLARAVRATGEEERRRSRAELDDDLDQLRKAAAPVVSSLNLEQLEAVDPAEVATRRPAGLP